MRRRTYLKVVGGSTVPLTYGCLAHGDGQGRFLLGAYVGADPSSTDPRPIERWLGTSHAVATLYVNANLGESSIDSFVADRVEATWQSGRVPILTWLPYLSTSAETPADVERRIAEGEYDRFVDRWASRLSEWVTGTAGGADRRLYFRPLPEMNGSWLPWSATTADGDAADFVRAWRRIHDRFAAAGLAGDDVAWLWNPNAQETGDAPTEAYYPGDEYVDWLGVDGYNWGDSREWSDWTAPRAVFEPMVTRLRDLASKPIALPEFGSTSFRDGAFRPAAKARWITDAFEYVREAGIRMACWFNLDKETDWAVFGGTRGTGTYVHDGTRYPVYPAYKRAATTESAIGGGIDDGEILTDEQFSGAM